MKSISEFPYGNEPTVKNPMHQQLLLLETTIGIGRQFAIGYYDAIYDVFQICYSGFQQTEGHHYEERKLNGVYDRYYCIMPKEFTGSRGPRCIIGFMLLHDALTSIGDRDLFDSDINMVIENAKCSTPYLLITNDNRIFISEVGTFMEPIGRQFGAFCPSNIGNGHVYHAKRPVSRETIRYAVNLLEFDK